MLQKDDLIKIEELIKLRLKELSKAETAQSKRSNYENSLKKRREALVNQLSNPKKQEMKEEGRMDEAFKKLKDNAQRESEIADRLEQIKQQRDALNKKAEQLQQGWNDLLA